jgi:tetratricopeptide (TPR) repeat protein
MGDNEGSIEVLEQAARELVGKRQPRLLFGVRFNHAANLLRLHRAEEAVPIVKEVRKLVDRLGSNDLDLIRTRWLEGNLFAGLGQREEAVTALVEVRRALEKLPFDQALASLDLALVYRAEGRQADVQALAGEMLGVFTALEVQREAVAALMLFREAAEKGAVTEELVRKLQDYLAKARTNPKLRFEG